jgi:hypothetical protein
MLDHKENKATHSATQGKEMQCIKGREEGRGRGIGRRRCLNLEANQYCCARYWKKVHDYLSLLCFACVVPKGWCAGSLVLHVVVSSWWTFKRWPSRRSWGEDRVCTCVLVYCWYDKYLREQLKKRKGPCMVAHICSPSYLGDWNWEVMIRRPAWENSSWDLSPK